MPRPDGTLYADPPNTVDIRDVLTPNEYAQFVETDRVPKRLKPVPVQVAVDAKVRHPKSQEFHDILATLADLHDQKQKDYGKDGDPFANVRQSEEWGMPAWVGCMVRANDKIKRLQTAAIKGELANESAEDAFMDLAVYAVIGLVLYREDNDG